MIEASTGSSSWQSSNLASEIHWVAGEIRSQKFPTDTLRTLLKAMDSPKALYAEEGAIRLEIGDHLVTRLGEPQRFAKPDYQFAADSVELERTMRLGQQLAKESLRNLYHPWKNYQHVAEEELRSETAKRPELRIGWFARTFTSQRDNNVIGTSILLDPVDTILRATRRSFYARANFEATRTLLAMVVFERVHGSLPNTLNDLVTRGVLSELPRDPYSDRPFRYDRARELIYSVGPNGIDEAGSRLQENAANDYIPNDIVYSLNPNF